MGEKPDLYGLRGQYTEGEPIHAPESRLEPVHSAKSSIKNPVCARWTGEDSYQFRSIRYRRLAPRACARHATRWVLARAEGPLGSVPSRVAVNAKHRQNHGHHPGTPARPHRPWSNASALAHWVWAAWVPWHGAGCWVHPAGNRGCSGNCAVRAGWDLRFLSDCYRARGHTPGPAPQPRYGPPAGDCAAPSQTHHRMNCWR